MSTHEGKVAIVTGASRGIGFGIAQALVAGGARVCITARKQEALDEAAAHLGGADQVIAVAGNAADPDHQQAAVAATLDTFGPIDYLVNNTGINPVFGPLISIDLDAARKITEVNVLAALAWTQAVYRASMQERGGSVVNLSSIAGSRPAPGIAMYGASKAMLASLTQSLAVELGPTIRVNAVAPAVVKTSFASALYEGREAEVSAAYPLKRLGVPGDIGSVVSFLLSDDAAWMTGQIVTVDGGLLLTGGI